MPLHCITGWLGGWLGGWDHPGRRGVWGSERRGVWGPGRREAWEAERKGVWGAEEAGDPESSQEFGQGESFVVIWASLSCRDCRLAGRLGPPPDRAGNSDGEAEEERPRKKVCPH